MTSPRRRCCQATVATLRLLLRRRVTAVHLAQVQHVGDLLGARSAVDRRPGRRHLGRGRLVGAPDAEVAAGGTHASGAPAFHCVAAAPPDPQVRAGRATSRPDARCQRLRLRRLRYVREEPRTTAPRDVLAAVRRRRFAVLRLEPVGHRRGGGRSWSGERFLPDQSKLPVDPVTFQRPNRHRTRVTSETIFAADMSASC